MICFEKAVFRMKSDFFSIKAFPMHLHISFFLIESDDEHEQPYLGQIKPSMRFNVSQPVEVKELVSAVLRPGEIHTVVSAIRRHYKPATAACAACTIMVYSKTGTQISYQL